MLRACHNNTPSRESHTPPMPPLYPRPRSRSQSWPSLTVHPRAVTRVRVTFAAGAPTGHVMENELDRAASPARPAPLLPSGLAPSAALRGLLRPGGEHRGRRSHHIGQDDLARLLRILEAVDFLPHEHGHAEECRPFLGYQATIQVDGKQRKHSFTTPEEAALCFARHLGPAGYV